MVRLECPQYLIYITFLVWTMANFSPALVQRQEEGTYLFGDNGMLAFLLQNLL